MTAKARPNLQAAARKHTAEAVEALAKIMREGASEAVRVAAAKEILERGWGKTRALEGDKDGAKPKPRLAAVEWRIIDPEPRRPEPV